MHLLNVWEYAIELCSGYFVKHFFIISRRCACVRACVCVCL